jgi:hypothetical protein
MIPGRLGKKLGVVHDPRTIQVRALKARGAQSPPKTSYVGRKAVLPMFANDRYGCCVFATKGHGVIVHETSSRQREPIALTSADVLAAYSAVTGFDPLDPRTDNGAYMLDGMNYERRVGIGREADGTTHRIYAFAALKIPLTTAEFAWSHWVFGGVQIGAWLPLSAADQIRDGKPWEVVKGDRAEPGSWGGHAMHVVGYDSKGVELGTWGQRQRASWAWLKEYVDEAYVAISEDFIRKGGTTPQGFNVERLEAMLEEIEAYRLERRNSEAILTVASERASGPEGS